ncbi:hypothetical protein [Mesorhizobium sp. 128a]
MPSADEALKQFMEHQHRRIRRDFLVLERNKNVVANAADEEHKIGEKFEHDPRNEIGQTLEQLVSAAKASVDIKG